MEIKLAESAGFCFGVDRAVRIALESGGEKSYCTLGPIIHNSHVSDMLKQKGIELISSVNEAKPGNTVIICSHGMPKKAYDELNNLGIEYVDATCPYVRRIHKIVSNACETGRTAIIIGDRDHTEVKGISGWCENHLICQSPEELSENVEKIADKPVTMVAQTTIDIKIWEECTEIVKRECTNVEIFDTIWCNCFAPKRGR